MDSRFLVTELEYNFINILGDFGNTEGSTWNFEIYLLNRVHIVHVILLIICFVCNTLCICLLLLSFSQHSWRSKPLRLCCNLTTFVRPFDNYYQLAIKFRSNPPTLLKSETLKIPCGLDSNQWQERAPPSRESEQPLGCIPSSQN